MNKCLPLSTDKSRYNKKSSIINLKTQIINFLLCSRVFYKNHHNFIKHL